MEFSVERSINIKKRQAKILRQEMIKKEKFHIHDIIDYQQFLELYNQYGQGLSKEDFGEIYLDLSRGDYYSLKKNRCRILKNEEIDDEYICFIKQYVIKNFGLEKEKTVSYEEIQQMYQSIFTKLSETLFAEKILDISSHSLSCIKYDKTVRATIFTRTDDIYFRKEIPEKAIRKEIRKKTRETNHAIKELKNTIAEDRKLHIGDKISYSQFQEIYEIYGKELYTEYDFAKNILGISEGKAKNLIHKKIEEVEIWKNETLDLDNLLEIREGVIKSEGLHIKDKMTYEQFQRLYEKYAGKLSEEMFAEEILDISREALKNLKKGRSPNSIILGDINVSEEIENKLCQEIKKNEHVYKGKRISYEEFLYLYRKYAFVIGEIDFAKRILKMNEIQFRELKKGKCKTTRIFNIDSFEIYDGLELRQLRDIVIKENRLHIGDSISGQKFQRLYDIYGFGMSREFFGEKILDMKPYRISDILADSNENSIILLNEKVSKDEFKRIRTKFLKSREHCIGDMINYKEFRRLYQQYGEKLSEVQFAEKILFITNDNLKAIRQNAKTGRETAIFGNLRLSDAYMAKLKARIIEKYALYFRQNITPEFFDKIYQETNTILSKADFAKKILEVTQQSYYKMYVARMSESFVILGISGDNHNKKRFLEMQTEVLKTLLEKGYDYQSIAKETNLTEKQVGQKANNFYDEGIVDRQVSIQNYINHQLKDGQRLDKNRIEEEDKTYILQIKEKIAQDKQFEKLEDRCIDIVDDFKETKRSREQIMEYIQLCQERYAEDLKNMPRKTMETLQSVLEYLDSTNMTYNTFFIKACISQKNYTSANRFITFCMQKPDLTVQEKKDLQELRTMIREAIKINEAIELINLNRSIPEIMMQTGMNEVDIVKMKKHIQASQKLANENHKKIPVSPQEDWCQ